MRPPGKASSSDRRRGAIRALLYVGLLGTGIFAAWQGHKALVRPNHPAGRGRPPRRPGAEQPPSGERRPLPDPQQLATRPLASAGFERLQRDPGPIPPPPEAQRLWAHRQSRRGRVYETALYRVPSGSAPLEHYRRALAAEGFTPRGRPSGTDAFRVWAFARNDAVVRVSLRKGGRNATMDMLMLTVARPVRGRSRTD